MKNIFYPETQGVPPKGALLGTVKFYKTVEADELRVAVVGDLPNKMIEHIAQINGYVLHQKGWRDLVAPFSSTSPGAAAPMLVTLANGVRLYRFSVGDSMHAEYHVDHDYAPGTNAYHHVHWFPETDIPAGSTVTWRVSYVIAKGHDQNGNMLAARTVIDMTYTAPIGGTTAGTHIVTEASDAQSYNLQEPDTIILAEVELLSKTYAGNVIGLQADLHYLSDREVTKNKNPDFNL